MGRVTIEHRPAQGERPALELRRSSARRRTASAHPADGVIVVQLPAGLQPDDERALVDRLVDRVTGAARARDRASDRDLAERAHRLADRYLDGVRARSVRWSGRMQRRHGSCTPTDRTVRISRQLATCPDYVLDYVLVHELAHLHVPGHGPEFWALVGRYPDWDRAHGFLEGLEHAAAAAPIPPADRPLPTG